MNEKISNIRALAEKVELFSYMRKFTEDELTEIKNDFSNKAIILNDLEEELRETSAEIRERMKPVKEDIKTLLGNLKHKSELVKEDCFVEFDRKEKVARYFSPSTGEQVYERPLVKSEMQLTMQMKEAV